MRKRRTGRKNRRTERELPVFVYGTLLPGFGNYQWHLEGHTTLEEKATIGGRMYDYMGHYPVVDVVESGIISGMVMYINPDVYNEVLYNLDCLEGYEPGGKSNLYNRVVVKAKTESGDEVECYTYSMGAIFRADSSTLPPIEDGDWAEFMNRAKPKVVIDRSLMKFEAEQNVITSGASEVINSEQIAELLSRHYSGDWGECHPSDARVNNDSLESGDGAIMSIYEVPDATIWVYTEWDRSTTTILLPSEW